MENHHAEQLIQSRDCRWRARPLNSGSSLDPVGRIAIELVEVTGEVMAAVVIEASELASILDPLLVQSVELHPNGVIAIDATFSCEPDRRLAATDVAQMVERALEPAMLEDEPELRDQLLELRRMLAGAVALVDNTLSGIAFRGS